MFDAEIFWTSSVLIQSLNHWMWFSLKALSIVCSFNWALGLSTFGAEELHTIRLFQTLLDQRLENLTFWSVRLPQYIKCKVYIVHLLDEYLNLWIGWNHQKRTVYEFYEQSLKWLNKLIRSLWLNAGFTFRI